MTGSLVCAECECDADDKARGWVAYLVDLDDDDDEPKVITFCPTCAASELIQ
jgi:hypothetical protein